VQENLKKAERGPVGRSVTLVPSRGKKKKSEGAGKKETTYFALSLCCLVDGGNMKGKKKGALFRYLHLSNRSSCGKDERKLRGG